MTDLNHYRNQVGELTKKAKAHEDKEEYEQAYQTYISALDIFTHLLKCKIQFSLVISDKFV